MPRFFLRRQDNRRKKTLSFFYRVCSSHRPRPQRGNRQIEIVRPFRQRKRRQKPWVLSVEVVCSSRCHLFHHFLQNTTTKLFLCSFMERPSSSPRSGRRHLLSPRYTTQFSTLNPRTLKNSRSLFVTSVNPAALACAAIHKSLFPIICPLRSSSARIVP